jgi:hypothetical protein
MPLLTNYDCMKMSNTIDRFSLVEKLTTLTQLYVELRLSAYRLSGQVAPSPLSPLPFPSLCESFSSISTLAHGRPSDANAAKADGTGVRRSVECPEQADQAFDRRPWPGPGDGWDAYDTLGSATCVTLRPSEKYHRRPACAVTASDVASF